MKTSSTLSEKSLRSSLDLFEVKPSIRFSKQILMDLLPDAETALFFGKVYELDFRQLSNLLATVLQEDLAAVLFGGSHSTELQSYIVDDLDVYDNVPAHVYEGQVAFDTTPPPAVILPQLWESLKVDVAQSIKDVAAKLGNTIGMMPGKQGEMVFKTMAKLNLRRPTIGDYRATIAHGHQLPNLVIMDDSGSVSASTVRALVDEAVGLSYMADASFALVSDTTRTWAPGSYNSQVVLAEGQYSGTHYETLTALLNSQDWGTVVTIADYDSSQSAKQRLARDVHTSIEQVLDISLVNKPTFLAECVGQFAKEVKPLLIGSSDYVLT